jgi:hypothetical protein
MGMPPIALGCCTHLSRDHRSVISISHTVPDSGAMRKGVSLESVACVHMHAQSSRPLEEEFHAHSGEQQSK